MLSDYLVVSIMLPLVCLVLLFGLVVESAPLPPLPDDHCDRCPTKLAPNDANVLRAAYFVVGQLGPSRWLVKVQRAEAERRLETIVAPDGRHKKVDVGLNYYLLLKIWEHVWPRPGPKHCRATVWLKLDGTMETTMSGC